MTDNRFFQRKVNRRRILREGAALAVGAGLLPGLGATTASAQAGGKVIIGAFADGALTPFKDKIIPLAKAEAGFEIEFLEDEYGVTLEKWFADAQSGAGQYDIYLLDDPWVPQFGAAEVLEDLGAAGIDGSDPDWIGSMIDMGFWPPRQGPRVKGFEDAAPKLISRAVHRRPPDPHLPQRRLQGRRAQDLGRADRQGQGGRGGGHDQIPGRVPRRFRARRSSSAGFRCSCRSAASSSTTSGT